MSRQVVIAVAALLFGVILLAILGIGIAVLVTVLNQKYSSGGSVVGTTTEATAPAVSYSPESDRFAKNLFSRINFSVDPCEDFYEYACGRWAESNPVPAYLSSWSEYTKVSMQVSQDVKDAIENADLATSSEGVKKTKHFYDKCMDTKASEELKGTKLGALLHSGVSEDPSLPGFDKGSGKWPLIDKSYKGNVKWEQRIGQLKKSFGIDTVMLAYALQYPLQSNKTILWLTGQMLPLGLGLMKWDYYLKPKYQNVMDAYQKLQKTVATLLARDSGLTNVVITQEDLDGMLNVEKRLAKFTRDSMMEGTDALWTLQELKKNVSATFDWDLFFKNLVSDELYHKIIYDKSDLVVQLDTPVFLKNVINMIQTSKDRDLQNYAIWRLVKYSLPYLSSEYTAALNDFNNAFPGSASKETPRAGVCLSYIKGNFELPNLGFATSEAYGKKHFLIDAQEASKQIVVNVKAGLEQLITSADWMDNTTRKNALDKAGKMDVLMAYPDWTMNQTAQNQYYKNLKIPPSVSFISLNLMLRGWAVQKNFEGVLKPVDRKDFVGSPVRTDAWYSKSTNAFTMPVGELQYPFYGYGSPLAMNYGAAGAVAGHEMSHGFDVDGSQYDTNGNLANWWSPASKKQFEDRTKCLIDQFNHYCFKGAGCVNGRITAAENAADLGGLKAAYQAFKALPPQPTLARAPMFSSDQLFYLSFSSFYCNSQSLDEIKDDLASNGHSPAKYRVIGTLRNIPEFSKAFSCKLGSYMNPEKKCAIW